MKNLFLIACSFLLFQGAFAQNDTIMLDIDQLPTGTIQNNSLLEDNDQIPNEMFQNNAIFTGSKVTVEEAMAFLKHHNMARTEVGVPALVWSSDLATVAQKHAEKLAAANCAFEHSGNRAYGENLFGGGGIVFTALDGSKSWYSEKESYTYSNSKYNHYTAMIWKTTTEVGAGVAQCEDGFYIIVANYAPAGNMRGSYPY